MPEPGVGGDDELEPLGLGEQSEAEGRGVVLLGGAVVGGVETVVARLSGDDDGEPSVVLPQV